MVAFGAHCWWDSVLLPVSFCLGLRCFFLTTAPSALASEQEVFLLHFASSNPWLTYDPHPLPQLLHVMASDSIFCQLPFPLLVPWFPLSFQIPILSGRLSILGWVEPSILGGLIVRALSLRSAFGQADIMMGTQVVNKRETRLFFQLLLWFRSLKVGLRLKIMLPESRHSCLVTPKI